MAFDLSKVNLQASSEVGHEFQLKLPDGTPIDGVFIKVRGANSKIALDLQKRNLMNIKFVNQWQRNVERT